MKEEKRSIGRPKLADTDLKRKSLIVVVACLLVSIGLLITGAYQLNIIPGFGRLSGTVVCSSIPEELAYDENTNPNGFKDPKFYSLVVNSYNSWDDSYCTNMDTDKLAEIDSIYSWYNSTYYNIESFNGIQYLTNLSSIAIAQNNDSEVPVIDEIDLSNNSNLIGIDLIGVKYSDLVVNDPSKLTNFRSYYNTAMTDTLDFSSLTNVEHFYYGGSEIEGLVLPQSNSLTEITLSNLTISEPLDFGNLPSLNRLSLEYVYASSLNLSGLSNLSSLYLEGTNQLTSLDLPDDSSLESLNIQYKNLSDYPLELDLHDQSNLTSLSLQQIDGISSIDFPDNSSLESLYMSSSNNSLQLDLSDQTNLTGLELSYMYGLSSINVNGLPSLKTIKLSSLDALETLNMGSLPSLESLKIDWFWQNNALSELDLSGLTALKKLELNYISGITSLNFENAAALEEVYIYNVNALSPNFSNCKELKKLVWQNSLLTTIDISECSKLEYLSLNSAGISSLDLSKAGSLSELYVNNNDIDELNLENNKKLTYLNVSDNNLTRLDLSNNTLLNSLSANNNDLVYLDVSKCNRLKALYAEDNEIQQLDVRSARNLVTLDVSDNTFASEQDIILGAAEPTLLALPAALNPVYDVTDENIVSIENSTITGLATGTTSYTLSYKKDMYGATANFAFSVNVVEITSPKCTFDHTEKTVDCSEYNYSDITEDDFVLSSNNYTPVIEDNKLIIKKGRKSIAEYTIIGAPEPEPSDPTDDNPTNPDEGNTSNTDTNKTDDQQTAADTATNVGKITKTTLGSIATFAANVSNDSNSSSSSGSGGSISSIFSNKNNDKNTSTNSGKIKTGSSNLATNIDATSASEYNDYDKILIAVAFILLGLLVGLSIITLGQKKKDN